MAPPHLQAVRIGREWVLRESSGRVLMRVPSRPRRIDDMRIEDPGADAVARLFTRTMEELGCQRVVSLWTPTGGEVEKRRCPYLAGADGYCDVHRP